MKELFQRFSWHCDGGIFYSGGIDFIGKLWDIRSCSVLKNLTSHSGSIVTSIFDSSHHVYSGGQDNSIISWDLRKTSKPYRIAAHTSSVTSLDVKDHILISSSFDKSIKFWSCIDHRLYHSIEECFQPVLCFKSTEHCLVTISKDGKCRLYGENVL